MLLIMFFKLLFKKSYKMSEDLWRALSPLLGCSMVLIFLFIINMGSMKEGVTIIESTLGTKQGDPLGGPLFPLTHYQVFLETIMQTPQLCFSILVDDTHIMGTMSEIVFAFDHLLIQLTLVGLKVKVSKCKLWSPYGLGINIPHGYILVTNGLCILGVPMGF